jgi:hypothetical protein
MARPIGPDVSIFSRNPDELDVEMVQLVGRFEEVPNRTAEPIEAPYGKDLEAATTGIAHQPSSPVRRLRARMSMLKYETPVRA